MTEHDDHVIRLQEAYANAYNEITQPDTVFVATQYFRKQWVPRLGPALSWLIIALRQHCYWNRQTGEKRDWCLVTQEIGVTPKTVRRQKNLANPAGFLRTSIESGETAPHFGIRNSEFGLSSGPAPKRCSEPVEGSEIPDLEVPGTDMTSRELWKAALDQLQLQMPRATFDSWLKNTYVSRVGEDRLTITCLNSYAKEWLESRLDRVIRRTLAGLLDRPVTAEYGVATEGS